MEPVGTARRRTTIRLRRGLAIGASGLLVTFLAAGPAAGSGTATGVFSGQANARLVGLDVAVAPSLGGFPTLVDAGVAYATARIDSLGNSTAEAADPYPSTVVVGLDGLLGTLSNGAVGKQIPQFPLYTHSAYPETPNGHVAVGPLQLSSSSASGTSTGSATDGLTVGTASVTTDPATGDVVARSQTTAGSVGLGVVTIHGLDVSAEARKSLTGKLTRTSSFAISSMSVLGQQFKVTQHGLALAKSNIPIGAVGQTLQSLLGRLSAQGISVQYVPAKRTATGITSAGVVITVPVKNPYPKLPLLSGISSIKAAVTIGGNSVSVTNSGLPDLGGLPGGTTPSSVPGVGSTGTAPGSSVTNPIGGALPTGPIQTGDVASPPAVAGPGTTTPSTALVSALQDHVSTLNLFPILALAGALLYGAVRLFTQRARSAP